MRLYILILLAVIVMIGCDKKDDPPPITLVGKWEITDAKVKLLVGDKPLKDYLIEQGYSESEAEAIVDDEEGPVKVNDVFKGEIFEFQSDGTLIIITSNDIQETGTWKLSDDKKDLTLTYDADPPGTEAALYTVLSLAAVDLNIEASLGISSHLGFPREYLIMFTMKRV